MQNRQYKSFFYTLLLTTILGCAVGVHAQELEIPVPDLDVVTPAEEAVAAPAAEEAEPVTTPAEEDTIASQEAQATPKLDGKEPVDFPPRSSMGTMELTPLPGVFETPITGPAPLTPSVSSKDLPSEQLLGRLNPDVFQELAELERENVFLKLQADKQRQLEDLENARARYRRSRLEEIEKREELIRARITWWQQQESERLRLDRERADMESAKAALEDAKMQKEMLLAQADEPAQAPQDAAHTPPPANQNAPANDEEPAMGEVAAYTLLSVQGTRSNLTATIRNTDTNRVSRVRVGDTLSTGDIITSITPTQVVMSFQGSEYVLTFDDGQ